ncbi:MAG: hypothetical protein H0T42_19675 [Deltaproteobacteria bacterium]|nr:hypothetical protein [Deltaproteobacteria bacterium]
MTRALVLLLVFAACQGGQTSEPPASGSGTASGSASKRGDAGAGFGNREDAAAPRDPPDAPAKTEEPDVADPGKLIAELDAIPAWQAVVDRAQLLARRNQRGVVYGRIGPAVMVPGPAVADAGTPPLVASSYVWLVDDQEGNGTLGIRVKLGDKAKEGDRVALTGAWILDEERRWYWAVGEVTPLPPAPPSDLKDPPAPVPSHAIVNGDLPAGARTISVARDHDAVYFQIVGPPPVNDGDGWLVANELGDLPVAMMNLPGERPSYGGQDMRAADERWQLKRGQTYWVRIGKLRKRVDKPALVNARTAPVRVM